jgi:hypothetical protein
MREDELSQLILFIFNIKNNLIIGFKEKNLVCGWIYSYKKIIHKKIISTLCVMTI